MSQTATKFLAVIDYYSAQENHGSLTAQHSKATFHFQKYAIHYPPQGSLKKAIGYVKSTCHKGEVVEVTLDAEAKVIKVEFPELEAFYLASQELQNLTGRRSLGYGDQLKAQLLLREMQSHYSKLPGKRQGVFQKLVDALTAKVNRLTGFDDFVLDVLQWQYPDHQRYRLQLALASCKQLPYSVGKVTLQRHLEKLILLTKGE